MSTVLTGGLPSQINRDARHLLLIEGEEDGSFDPSVLRALLDTNDLAAVNVAALGSCENIQQAAKAMYYQHQNYYFVIDRDGRKDAFVEASWTRFPDPTCYNLLVWRKHELENYFIDPDYLSRSEFLKLSEDQLRDIILKECQQRLFLTAANLVLLGIREELMQPPNASFRNPSEFKDRAAALAKLLGCNGLQQKDSETQALLAPAYREAQLDSWIQRLSGDKAVLEYGVGDWLSLITGKEIFNAVVGRAFEVKDTDNNVVHGRDKCTAIARKLLAQPISAQPNDFRQLVDMIKQRVLTK
jgi:hypothetical protein